MKRGGAVTLAKDTTWPAPRRKAGGYAWHVVAVLSFCHLVSFIDRFVMSLALAPIKVTFGVSDTILGLLHGTGFVLLYCVAAVPLGRYVDIGHRRNLIVFGILVWSAATAACGLARSVEELMAARIVVGLGEACLIPAAMSLITAYVPPDVLARAVSVFTTGATLGASTALIGGGLIIDWIAARGGLRIFGLEGLEPWRWAFLLAAAPGVLAAILLLSVREPPRPTKRAASALKDSLQHLALHWRAYALHFVAACAIIILYQALAAWTPTFLIRRFGLTVAQSGATVGSLLLLAGPAGNLAGGWITDRLQAAGSRFAPSTVLAAVLLAALAPGAAFCWSHSYAVSAGGWTLLMICVSAGVPATWVGIQLVTPDALKGTISALYLAAYTLVGVGLGPVLVGLLTDNLFGAANLGRSLLAITLGCGVLGSGAALIGRRVLSAAAARVSTSSHRTPANA